MSNFFLSYEAEEDLQNIYNYSEEQWGEEQATKYIFDLDSSFRNLGQNPKLGRTRRDLAQSIRSIPQSSHIIFFTEWQGEGGIVRILHSSRDFPAIFENYNSNNNKTD